MPNLPDSAVLVKFKDNRPEIIKVYNFKKDFSDHVPVSDVFEIVYELANTDLITKTKGPQALAHPHQAQDRPNCRGWLKSLLRWR